MAIARLSRRTFTTGLFVSAASAVAGFVVARGGTAAEDKPVTAAANDYGPAPKDQTDPALAAVEDVPANGILLAEAGVVLIREGEAVRAFSATCTHQGCTVEVIADGLISCPCHGSQFDVKTGAVRRGPAARPLPEVEVVVRDCFVYKA